MLSSGSMWAMEEKKRFLKCTEQELISVKNYCNHQVYKTLQWRIWFPSMPSQNKRFLLSAIHLINTPYFLSSLIDGTCINYLLIKSLKLGFSEHKFIAALQTARPSLCNYMFYSSQLSITKYMLEKKLN